MWGQKGSLEGRKSKSRQFSVGKEGLACYIGREMLTIQGEKQQEKICQCYWKTKGSLPKTIMKSHCSNVRLGPLLQLTGFTHQEKEASLFSAQIRLETLDTTLKGIPPLEESHETRPSLATLDFSFLFGVIGYGEQKSTLPTPETSESGTLSSYKQIKGKEKPVLVQTEFIFSFPPLKRRAKQALLSSISPFRTN